MPLVTATRMHKAGAWSYPSSVRALLTPLLGLALTGCDEAAGPAGEALVRDSAGVRIVEYAAAPAADAPFAFSPEPVYSHGSGNGNYAFQSIWAGRLLPDGSAAISDDGNDEVVIVAPDGAAHHILARSGQGPGEVGFVASLFVLSQDSLLLEDDVNRRFTLFVNGSPARTVTVQDPAFGRGLSAHGLDSSGQLLMSTSSYRSGFEEAWLQGKMVRFNLDTGVPDTVASYDFAPYTPREGPQNPFAGFGRVTAAAGHFLYTRSDKAEITWRLPDGTVRQIVRWRPEPVYPTEEHLEPLAARTRTRLRFANPQGSAGRIEEMVMEQLAGYQILPDTPLPFFSRPLGDGEGRVWLPTYVPGGPREGLPPYSVVSPEGEWLGRVDAPPRLRILDVAGGRVLGVVKDEMDVESIVVYELVDM